MDCDHSGTYSGASRYIRETGQLRFVLVCDRCGAERSELTRLSYRPHARRVGAEAPEPNPGNHGLTRSDV